MKKRYILLSLLLILFLVFILGPRPSYPEINPMIESVNYPLTSLDKQIADKEAKVANLKPDNQSRIIWADSLQQTEYSIVYLHGFSASPMEADPVHLEFAKRYGCNMYLARLAQHGIKNQEIFKDLTPKDLVDSAKEAIAIGQLLGKKVILMSCSTGSTLSAYLTAHNPDLVDGQIMYSPNINIGDPNSKLLTLPWGLPLFRYMMGGNYRSIKMPKAAHNYWTMKYRLEGVIALRALLDETMKESYFKKITQPLFVGYYHENEEKEDKIISIPAANNFFEKVSTPDNLKTKIAFPNVNSHVIVSGFQSKDLDSVRKETFKFAEEKLGLKNKVVKLADEVQLLSQ